MYKFLWKRNNRSKMLINFRKQHDLTLTENRRASKDVFFSAVSHESSMNWSYTLCVKTAAQASNSEKIKHHK